MRARALLLLLLLLLLVPAIGSAQTSAVPLSHWQHTAWTGDRAPPLPIINSLRRSGDGYLWLGSFRGLVRFDGERFTLLDSTYSPLLDRQTPGSFDPLLVDRTGRMWVAGALNTFFSYANGEFRQELDDSGYVHAAVEDGEGRLWVAVDARLRLFRNGRFGPGPLPSAVPDTGILDLAPDHAGGFWVGTLTDGLWHVSGSVARHFGTGRMRPLLHASDGSLWILKETGNDRGMVRLKNGVFSRVLRSDRPGAVAGVSAVEGWDGSVWIPTYSSGLLRWRDGVTESYTMRDGLSSNTTKGVFASAEGAVWVTTDAGVDRLRPASFVPVQLRDGIPDEAPASFAIDTGGALWSAVRSNVLYRHDRGIVRREAGPVIAERRELRGIAVNLLEVLGPSRRGGLWLSPVTGGHLVYYHDGRVQQFGPAEGVPVQRPWTAIEAPDGTLWVRHFPNGFGRLRDGQYRKLTIAEPGPDNMAIDAAGRLWNVPTSSREALVLSGDSIVERIPLPGSNAGIIYSVAFERGDTLWASGRRSLFRIGHGTAVEVEVPEIQPILDVTSRLAVARGQLWVASEAGLAAVPLADLHRQADGEAVHAMPTFFDQLDGLMTPRSKGSTRKSLQVGPDGRLWIATPTGFAVSDDSPRVLNGTPPAVHIEEVTLAGRAIALGDGGSIEPNPERLAFRFSAPSLGLAERVRVQYRLEGADKDWIGSVPPRLAQYDHLRPGRYRFLVRAWNEAGTPSGSSASLSFRVLPAWYQTSVFFTLCVVAIALAGAALAATVARARHRRAASAVEARYEAVLAERTRLARELHDTLLQGFTGLTLQIDGVRAELEGHNEQQSAALSAILQRADRTLRDAREMVWEMRTNAPDDLGKALQAEGDALVNPDRVAVEYIIHGAPRSLAPTVVTTILRIAREAMANAMNHAHAKRIVVKLAYESESVELEVQDDGCGADLAAVESAATRGHWGVAGMRERARSVGGALTLSAEPGRGTRVGIQIKAPPVQRPAQNG